MKLTITMNIPDEGADYTALQTALRRVVTTMGYWQQAELGPKVGDSGKIFLPGTKIEAGGWLISATPSRVCMDPLAHATDRQFVDLMNGRTTITAIEHAYHGAPDVPDVSTD